MTTEEHDEVFNKALRIGHHDAINIMLWEIEDIDSEEDVIKFYNKFFKIKYRHETITDSDLLRIVQKCGKYKESGKYKFNLQKFIRKIREYHNPNTGD